LGTVQVILHLYRTQGHYTISPMPATGPYHEMMKTAYTFLMKLHKHDHEDLKSQTNL